MKKSLALFIFSAVFSSSAIFSQTANDSLSALPLYEIDKIIDAKEYNRALTELSVYMQIFPRDFDRAQKRVKRIMKERLEYDKKAEELADTMLHDNENDEKKMDLIIELENSEKNQTKTAIDLTRQARKTLAMRFFIDRYNKIMRAGLALVKEEKFGEAAQKFQEGFNLKGNDTDRIFDGTREEGILVVYEDDITKPADESMQKIAALVPGINSLIIDCQKDYEFFMESISKDNLADTKAAVLRIERSFGLLAQTRNKITKEIAKLQEIDKIANERNPLLSGFSYITFTLGFVEGDEHVAETGVIGTIDTFWNTRVENMKDKVYETVLGKLKETEKPLPLTKIRTMPKIAGEQAKKAEEIAQFPPLGRAIQSLYGKIEKKGGGTVADDYTEYEKSMVFAERFAKDLGNALASSKFLSEYDFYAESQAIEDGKLIMDAQFIEKHLEIAQKYEEIVNLSKIETYIREELIREESYFEIQEILSDENLEDSSKYNQMEVADLINEQKKIAKTPGRQLIDAVLDFRDVIGYQETLSRMNSSESTSNSSHLWKSMANLFAENAKEDAENESFKKNQAEKLLSGVESNGEVRKYPSEAKQAADDQIPQIEEKIARFKKYQESLAPGEKYRKTAEERDDFAKKQKTISDSIASLEKTLLSSKEISQKGAEQVLLAKKAESEAEAHIRRAEAALLRQDFTGARNSLSRASAKYSESFAIQESAENRAISDAKISNLSGRIIREENEIVIRDVRVMMEDAQDYYYNGRLELAEGKLVSARERWSETNAEPNVEIEELLEMVTTARTLQIGRKLKSTDPLYSEMSLLLSAANLHYSEGEKFMKEGKKAEAIAALENAKDKLEPMKLIYPLNEDASLLRLKIEKVLDPAAFEAGFKNRVDEARAKKSTAERLAALRDLQAINPQYPNLAKEIEELEYDTGIRQRKVVVVDNSQEIRAQSLYEEAESIFRSAGTNQERLAQASSRLDEIIRLYSRNRRAAVFRQATALKDRIQSRIGGTVVAALTADDESNFQKAQNAVNRGQLDEANDILERIWKNPAAQKTKKIVDLRTFVKNRL